MFNATPYHTPAVQSLDSPALLVYPKMVRENIMNALNIVTGKHSVLRPHVKTVKCKEVVAIAMAYGIDRFKCSTIAEAELLAQAGIGDILLSYQLSMPKARRFANLRNLYPKTVFSSLLDNLDSGQMLSEVFQEHPVAVFIDLNVGMDRTGIQPEQAFKLIKDSSKLKGINIVGLHAYDGHIHSPNADSRKSEADQIFETVDVLRNKVEEHLDKKIKVVLGGSPSFGFYGGRDHLECSPGTIFFWDAGYGSNYPELPFVPAVVILTRILSIVNECLICFDLGSKAVAADPPQPRMVILDLKDYAIIAQYEEHLVVQVPDTKKFQVGQPFFAIPHHVCPTVNLYENLNVIKENRLAGTWKVAARNRTITV